MTPGERPSFSVIVPTYRRPDVLAGCLRALAALDYPGDRFEVIVVDDGGGVDLTPATGAAPGTLALQVVSQDNAGPAAARNRGAREAGGELLAFTDDDCRPHRDWLARMAAWHERHPTAMIGGRRVNDAEGNPYSAATELIVEAGTLVKNRAPSGPRFFSSDNIAVPREGFGQIGGFDPAYRTYEDHDLCARWLAAGRPMVYAPDAVVGHEHELALGSFWRQHYGWGAGAATFHGAQSDGLRGGVPLYGELARAVAADRAGIGRVRTAALVAVWQAASAAGYAAGRLSSRRSGRAA